MTSSARVLFAIVALLALILGCSSEPIVAQKGDHVKVMYVGRTMDDEVFDSTTAEDMLEFEVGQGQVVPGVDRAVEGMAEGESKSIELEMEDAYGPRNEQAVGTVARGNFPADLVLEVGKTLAFNPPGGAQQLFTVVSFDDDSVTLDGNHPLAGKKVKFDLTLVKVERAEE